MIDARRERVAVGAGAKHRFGFADRLLATLVHLRPGLTDDVVAAWFGVHRSTVTRSLSTSSFTRHSGFRSSPTPATRAWTPTPPAWSSRLSISSDRT